jgi:hypothetical protein
MAALVRSDPTSETFETTATIIASVYQYAKLRDINLEDRSVDHSYYLVSFSYKVNGEVYFDEFESSVAYEPGKLIEIVFNPSNPQENSRSEKQSTVAGRIVFWTVGIALGFIIAYLAHHFGWAE